MLFKLRIITIKVNRNQSRRSDPGSQCWGAAANVEQKCSPTPTERVVVVVVVIALPPAQPSPSWSNAALQTATRFSSPAGSCANGAEWIELIRMRNDTDFICWWFNFKSYAARRWKDGCGTLVLGPWLTTCMTLAQNVNGRTNVSPEGFSLKMMEYGKAEW